MIKPIILKTKQKQKSKIWIECGTTQVDIESDYEIVLVSYFASLWLTCSWHLCCSILPVSAMTEILRFLGTDTFMDEFYGKRHRSHRLTPSSGSDPEHEIRLWPSGTENIANLLLSVGVGLSTVRNLAELVRRGTTDAEIKDPPCGSPGLSKVPSF